MSLWGRVTSWIRPQADMVSDLRHPTAWLTHWALGSRTRAGMYVNPDSAMTLATYYACVRNISEDVAKLPLITYKRLLPRGKERATDHPAYALLHDAPNDDMTAMSFRESLTHFAVAWGNGYAEIVRNGRGRIMALYPIHPSRVCLRRDEAGDLVYDIHGSGSAYQVDGRQYGYVRLQQEDVLHIKGLGCDGYEGYSVFRLAAESLGLTMAAETFGSSFFEKGTHLGGVLEHPGVLKDTAKDYLRQSWQEMYAGPQNAGKVAILEEGMKFSKLGIPPEEAQYLETRQFQVREVCRWFRMPPHKLADLTDAHYTNIEEQNLEYVTDTLMPWLTRWEQELKRKLFDDDPDHFAEHLILGLLRGDSEKRANYFQKRFDMGSLSQDEMREAENENPLPNGLGSHYWIAANNYMPLDAALGATNGDEAQAQEEVRPRPFVPQVPAQNGHVNGHSNGHAVAVEDEE